MHEEHKSLVYSVAVLATMAFAEHVFIYSIATKPKERQILIVIHYLTVIAYSLNILLRGRRVLWGVFVGFAVALHVLILNRWSNVWVTACLTALDTFVCTLLFERVFYCDEGT